MANKPQSPAPVVQSQAIRPQNFMELERFATMASKSDFVPKNYQGKPDNIMIAIQMGSELGLAPMQSLQSIAVINGRPAVYGDALIGLCRTSPLCEDIQERMEGEGETLTAYCLVRRRGASPVGYRFGVPDAKRAHLWGKQGPWTEYPQRMLQMRARGFALRDAFPDLLRGLVTAEEANDIPRGPTIEGERPEERGEPEPPKPAPAPPPPPPAPPEPPRPAAAPSVESPAGVQRDSNGSHVARPSGTNGRTEAEKTIVQNWLARRQADLDAASSLDEIRALIDANAASIERLRDDEHAQFDAMVVDARERLLSG